MPLPSRKCPKCREWIEGDGVVFEGREYCSSDCAIDAYEFVSKRRTKDDDDE
jgi:hypothetical protein